MLAIESMPQLEHLGSNGRHAQEENQGPESALYQSLEQLNLKFGNPQYHSKHVYHEKVELHKGRHSTVWSCKHRGSSCDSIVVLKGYSKARLRPRQLANVHREIRLLQRLNAERQPGIVELLAAFEDEETIFLCFSPCLRGDLYQIFVKHKEREGGNMLEHFVSSQVVSPLLATLGLLHRLDIVHRDIKPENLFVTLDGELQVGDFGLAADKRTDPLIERVGTLDYMAPEVLAMPTPDEYAAGRGRNLKPYDEKVDVWAVGILCYELLVGKPPYEVEDPKQTARLILQATPPTFPADLSESAVDFIKSALSKKAKLRPSVEEMFKHPWVLRHSHSQAMAYYGPVTPDLPQRMLKPSWSMSEHVSPSTSRGSQSLDPLASEDSNGKEGGSGAPSDEAQQRADLLQQPIGFMSPEAHARAQIDVKQALVEPKRLGQPRRASSGTSEYLGYATPAKPSSPEAPSRSQSITFGSGQPLLSPLGVAQHELAKSTSTMCLQSTSSDPGVHGLHSYEGSHGGHSEGSDSNAIAWQSLQPSGGSVTVRKQVGKSRFAR